MCNPLLDISADVPLDLLEKYGVQLNNAILANPEHVPLYDELVTKYPVQYIAGGAGQNSIRVAQWILQIPGATAFLGAVGTDEYGQTLGTNDYLSSLSSSLSLLSSSLNREMCQ